MLQRLKALLPKRKNKSVVDEFWRIREELDTLSKDNAALRETLAAEELYKLEAEAMVKAINLNLTPDVPPAEKVERMQAGYETCVKIIRKQQDQISALHRQIRQLHVNR